jgi:hypothetical protein
VSTATAETKQHKGGSGFGKVLAERFLLPLVATLASAAAGYAAKHGPRLFEQKVLPRLRDADVPKPDPDRARELVHDVNERAMEFVQAHTPEPVARIAPSVDDGPRPSNAERADARAERAAHRDARRRASRR